MLGLVRGASLPVHFTHGVPALCAAAGQACAALVDLLAQGLSFGRVERLLAHRGGSPALHGLPPRPLAGVPANAALTTLGQWRRALAAAATRRSDGADVEGALAPVLEMIVGGIGAAGSIGPELLPPPAAALWRIALRRAPAAALPFTLATLRVPDGMDPGASVAWGPAAHLAGSPRPWTRLVGMTSRAWPRPRREDPLLPAHVLPLDPLTSPSRPETDRRRFVAIRDGTARALSLSFARRAATGGAQAPSPLLPATEPRRLGRLRTPEHAYSESDRLLARPQDGADEPRLFRPVACARARRRQELTAWDGPLRPDHELVAETLGRPQSPSSLRMLIRDPQAFVWRYALGWRATLEESSTISLDDRAFGDLVHLLLQHAVETLERGPGFARAADHQVAAALDEARRVVGGEWPSTRATPPPMLWRHTLDKAVRLALVALSLDGQFREGTRSWTEVPFGHDAPVPGAPWSAEAPVPIEGTGLHLRGRIDRVEIAAGARAVRVTDYKTGVAPDHAARLALDGGAELQRPLYALAAGQHLPDASIYADLVYLGDEMPRRYRLDAPDLAIDRVRELLEIAARSLMRGASLPGPDAAASWSEYRLARPAAGEPATKALAVAEALAELRHAWTER